MTKAIDIVEATKHCGAIYLAINCDDDYYYCSDSYHDSYVAYFSLSHYGMYILCTKELRNQAVIPGCYMYLWANELLSFESHAGKIVLLIGRKSEKHI